MYQCHVSLVKVVHVNWIWNQPRCNKKNPVKAMVSSHEKLGVNSGCLKVQGPLRGCIILWNVTYFLLSKSPDKLSTAILSLVLLAASFRGRCSRSPASISPMVFMPFAWRSIFTSRRPAYPPFLVGTRPKHVNLTSLTLCANCSTWAFLLKYSFLNLPQKRCMLFYDINSRWSSRTITCCPVQDSCGCWKRLYLT